MKKILIVGGVAGGATTAARLRRLDEDACIIMFERSENISYASCGLPYYIGGVIANRDDLFIQTPTRFNQRYKVDVRTQSEVVAIHRATKTVHVQNYRTGEVYTESYDVLVLAPGAQPIRPPIEGIDSKRVFFLRDIRDADKIKAYIQEHNPASAAIVGGGFIGIELAENLYKAGLRVRIIELLDQVLAPLDIDIACEVHHYLREQGVSLYLENGVQRIRDSKDGLGLTLELSNGSLQADMVIMAVGVSPESHLAKSAGLDTNARGSIVVDTQMRTSDPDIYAVGDVVEVRDFVTGEGGMVPLAGSANKQARVAADAICGISSEYEGTQGSSVIKVFDMTIACTGINEKTARSLGLDYDKAFLWHSGHAKYYPGSRPMSMKLLYEKSSGRILGAQIVGFDGVDKRCDILAVAIRAGMTAFDLTGLELCYSPPYASAKDPVNILGYMIENELTGKARSYHWHEVDALPRDNSAIILDVRSAQERSKGYIDGSIHIPLDKLRERIRELDPTKQVFIYCQSGVRSYIAARILSQNGFEAYSLSGGYRLYHSVQG